MRLELKVDNAIEEAKRFLFVAKKAQERIDNDQYAKYGSKETAACKRASMDLTRVLADLRRYED